MDRSSLVFLACLAEKVERYDDMVDHVREIVRSDTSSLSREERYLFSVAFKNILRARRDSYRHLQQLELKNAVHDNFNDFFHRYKSKVVGEMKHLCNEVLETIVNVLLPATDPSDFENRVFYYKMQGDYSRYMTEFQLNDRASLEQAQESYTNATILAQAHLPPTHPLWLGLVVNHSVFLYETMHLADQACRMVKEAFDGAIYGLEGLTDTDYHDATTILHILRNNVSLWTMANE